MVGIIRSMLEWVLRVQRVASLPKSPSISVASHADGADGTEITAVGPTPEEKMNPFSKRFEDKKKMQRHIDNACFQFNEKPSSGVKYMIENGLMENTVEDVVHFLKRNGESLNKSQIGEYMGSEKPFPLQVMHAFIDSLDFSGLSLDEGIRRLCTQFLLPGEGQKIDRIMQKFAERFCLQNEGAFRQADDAYILSYATIMLNVNLHHPNVKKRMTKEEFIKNNLLAVNDQNLTTMMDIIYNNLLKQEIVLDDKLTGQSAEKATTADALSSAFSWMNGLYNSNYYEPGRNYLQQRKNIMDKVTDKVQEVSTSLKSKRSTRKDNMFYEPHAEDLEALQPMFSVCWLPSLATFSVLLEDPQSETLNEYHSQRTPDNVNPKEFSYEQLVGLCLNGYRYGIKLASNLGMDVEAESYVNSLASFTLLGTDKIMEQKNIEATKTLIQIAQEEGNVLRRSWFQILKCVSELDVLHLIKSKEVVDATHFLSESERLQLSAGHSITNSKQYGAQLIEHHTKVNNGVLRFSGDHSNAAVVTAQIDSTVVDRIFTDSAKLDSEAIVHFAIALQSVSAVELDNAVNPRVFSLRKIVEVAHDNINIRIPLVWQRIWNVLAPHFVKAGCHTNVNIGSYAINSLRQLAVLFFEKEELTNFQFQSKFLAPFLQIMERSKQSEIRLMIVECIFRIVKARFNNVKSGWKIVFAVMSHAAKDPHEVLVSSTYTIVEQILQDYFPLLKLASATSVQSERGSPMLRGTALRRKSSAEQMTARKRASKVLGAETLDECVNCLVSFASNIWTDISLNAIANLVQCAQHLYDLDRQMKLDIVFARQDSDTDEKESSDKVSSSRPMSSAAASPSDGKSQFNPKKDSPMIKAWFLCLTGLSRLMFDSRPQIRSQALQALFKILKEHGAGFTSQMWELIFRGVLLPMFDDIYHNQIQSPLSDEDNASEPEAISPTQPTSVGGSAAPTSPQSSEVKSSNSPSSNRSLSHTRLADTIRRFSSNDMQSNDVKWLETTGVAALSELIGLFGLYFTNCRFILDRICSLLISGTNQMNQTAAKVSVKCWKSLVDKISEHLTETEWDLIVKSLALCMSKSLPFLLSKRYFTDVYLPHINAHKAHGADSYRTQRFISTQRPLIPVGFNPTLISVQNIVHLLVVDQLFQITVNHAFRLNPTQISTILGTFEASHEFARYFNQNTQLRHHLWAIGFMKHQRTAPDLFYQESRAASVALQILLTICTNFVPSSIKLPTMTPDTKLIILQTHRLHNKQNLSEFASTLMDEYLKDSRAVLTAEARTSDGGSRSHSHQTTPKNVGKDRNRKSSGSSGANTERQSTTIQIQPLSNDDGGLRWKTGVVLTLLDCLLSKACIPDETERMRIIHTIFDALVACVEVENREVRKRIGMIFTQHIKPALFEPQNNPASDV